MEFVTEYGLFLAKTVTIVVAVVIVIMVLFGLGQRNRRSTRGHIEVRSLNDAIEDVMRAMNHAILDEDSFKREEKSRKKSAKSDKKARKKQHARGDEARKRVYVVDFEGDLQASDVAKLREEVTAILSVAGEGDEVVLRLESPGGQVHGYGLAASQLSRIVSRNIALTVAVDKVAASGGYMMACIGSRIIAAPFALLGSIGVVAQLPNFHRFLDKQDVDFEVFTAGEYKRTVTIFGENTEKGREKFQEELEDVHRLFKDFVAENRPGLDVEAVSTGEAWYGKRALEHRLVDEIKTSDEYIVGKCADCDVYKVKYVEDKKRIDKLVDKFSNAFSRLRGMRDLTPSRGPWQF